MSLVINLLIISPWPDWSRMCVAVEKSEREELSQVNKTGELSLKCDCTPQCNSGDVGDAVALLDCWIFNTVRSVRLLFRASRCSSCEFWCRWMKCVGLRLIQLLSPPTLNQMQALLNALKETECVCVCQREWQKDRKQDGSVVLNFRKRKEMCYHENPDKSRQQINGPNLHISSH